MFVHVDPHAKQAMPIVKEWWESKPHVYVLVYMEGCGPCNQVRPEWQQLSELLPPRSDIGIIDIDQEVLPELQSSIPQPDAFPTILHRTPTGKIEPAELPDRSAASLKKWIEGSLVLSSHAKKNKKNKQQGKRRTQKGRDRRRRQKKTNKKGRRNIK